MHAVYKELCGRYSRLKRFVSLSLGQVLVLYSQLQHVPVWRYDKIDQSLLRDILRLRNLRQGLALLQLGLEFFSSQSEELRYPLELRA
jgi:hypothetical protein